MAETQNRTLICTVLFIDIVEYSRKPVVEQLHLKARFNELLTDALRDVAFKDRVIVDTGDGAACTFTGDPEDALFVATRLQENIAREAESEMSQLSARMGINLGPVRLVKDINGQPNVIGDGINVSQRIMNFAQPGQVLVSHSYHDAVSRLSGESSKLFTYQGSRTDKHIRDHEVYALSLTEAAEQQRSNEARRAARARQDAAANPPPSLVAKIMEVLHSKPHWYFSAGLICALLIAVVFRIYEKDILERAGQSAVAAPVVTAPVVPAPVVASAPEPAPPPPEAAKKEPVRVASRPETSKPEAKKADSGVLDLAIAPWGTVYIDGKERGASPPLRELRLSEGRHKIEIKNASFPDHVVMVDVKPGARVKIKHKFTR